MTNDINPDRNNFREVEQVIKFVRRNGPAAIANQLTWDVVLRLMGLCLADSQSLEGRSDQEKLFWIKTWMTKFPEHYKLLKEHFFNNDNAFYERYRMFL